MRAAKVKPNPSGFKVFRIDCDGRLYLIRAKKEKDAALLLCAHLGVEPNDPNEDGVMFIENFTAWGVVKEIVDIRDVVIELDIEH